MSNIKISVKHISPNVKAFSEEQLKYLDYERMDETLVRFEFPMLSNKKDKVLDDDIMEDIYYKFFAVFLKYQYKLPVKYLEPEIENCYYISQKSLIPNGSTKVSDAYISIEPLNQNIFKQISYTPINQAYDIGTIVSLHETIPYANSDGTTPPRRLLTSASLECQLLNKDIKYKGLCNRCIPYSSIDIGSEVVGKFVIKTNPLRESMALYRFRRPSDNILEIVTADYLNVDCKLVLKLTKEEMIKNEAESDIKNKIINIIDEMIKLTTQI